MEIGALLIAAIGLAAGGIALAVALIALIVVFLGWVVRLFER